MAATLFIESNFILELVFLQKQHKACRELLTLAQRGELELRLPAFCLMEPLFTLNGRRKSRKALHQSLATELGQYMREASGQADVSATISALNTLLIERGEDQQNAFITVVSEVIGAGVRLLPLDGAVWQQLQSILTETELELGDALVFASILHSLHTARPTGSSLFVSLDNHFKEAAIRQKLEAQDCTTLFDFEAVLARLKAQ